MTDSKGLHESLPKPAATAGVALPIWIVAGSHSGRNAEWVVSRDLPPGEGRWLWLTGALQQPLAAQQLAAAEARGAGGRLLLGSLPGACACCAASAQLGAGLARVLREQRRAAGSIDGLILQLEPDGDPGRLADNLLAAGPQAPWSVDVIAAVLSEVEWASLAEAATAPTGRSGARLLRCLGAASAVHVAAAATPAAANPPVFALAENWPARLVAAASSTAASTAAPWRAYAVEPFGAAAPLAAPAGPGQPEWRQLACWPASIRFDRRAVAAWLAQLAAAAREQARSAARADWRGSEATADFELALIARTERDWLGWQPGAAEVSLSWRLDSRLAVRGRLFSGSAGLDGHLSPAGAFDALVTTVPPPKL